MVDDSSGKAIDAVYVFIVGTECSGLTSRTGSFLLQCPVPARAYNILIRRIGFAADSVAIRMTPGKTYWVTARLRPVPVGPPVF